MDARILRFVGYRPLIGGGNKVAVLQVTADGTETEVEVVKTTVSHGLDYVAQKQIESGNQLLILDMCEIRKIDSGLLGVIVAAIVRSWNLDGELVLANLRPQVSTVFQVANIGPLPIFGSIEDALDYFNTQRDVCT